MAKMHSAQVRKPGVLELVQVDVTEPEAGDVRIRVEACGVCHKLVILGADVEPMSINTLPMIMQRQSIQGWPSGAPKDSEETLAFSALSGVRAMIETVPLAQAPQAYERMLSGKARFRMVITPQ
jgi:D-arabinose 1-dehydrogenase-like Zn-dependent alcohol dehydrogenase